MKMGFQAEGIIYEEIIKECKKRSACFGTCGDILNLWVKDE